MTSVIGDEKMNIVLDIQRMLIMHISAIN